MLPSDNSDRQRPKIPRLSEMEWEILKPLWEKGPMAARDIYREVPSRYNWAYKTVKTMLSRLVKKGAITYDQIGNSYLYRAVYSRKEMTLAAMNRFIHRVFNGTLSPFLAHFVESISTEELERLQKEVETILECKNRTKDIPKCFPHPDS